MSMFLLVAGILGSAHALDVQRSVEGEEVVVSAVLSHTAADVLALLAQHEATMRIGKKGHGMWRPDRFPMDARN